LPCREAERHHSLDRLPGRGASLGIALLGQEAREPASLCDKANSRRRRRNITLFPIRYCDIISNLGRVSVPVPRPSFINEQKGAPLQRAAAAPAQVCQILGNVLCRARGTTTQFMSRNARAVSVSITTEWTAVSATKSHRMSGALVGATVWITGYARYVGA
jgi:hypothetical protein